MSGNNKGKNIDFSVKLHEKSNIKKVIGIVSGKGGVGKSLVTSMLAVMMNKRGHKTAILDADITGPSIPKLFGIKEKAKASKEGLYPIKSKTGIEIMSINLILNSDTDPVIWRGPIIASTVKQFWSDVIWKDIDYMFIDMPPGTGDVPLTAFQSINIDGIIIVASPQELVSMIVSKSVKMAEMMNIPILGIVENMSYFKCNDCGKKHKIFGESHIEEIANKYNLEVLAKVPIDPKISEACDNGAIEEYEGNWLNLIGNTLEKKEDKMKIAVASDKGSVTEHFGHCQEFIIFDTEGKKILQSQNIENPGHKPGFLPNFLGDLDVNVIISGGMGDGAITIFNEKDIEVVVGASGKAEEVVEAYLKDELKSTGAVCHEHKYEDECH